MGPRNDVWESADAGTSWRQALEIAPWPSRWGHAAVALPEGTMLLCGGMGGNGKELGDVWRSALDGSNWTRLTLEAPWCARVGHRLVALQGGAESCLVLGGRGPGGIAMRDAWLSATGGESWQLICGEAPWPARSSFGAVCLASGRLLVAGGLGESGGLLNDVWSSEDRGLSWQQATATASWPARQALGLAALPDDAVLLTGGSGSGGTSLNDVWRSGDRGANWELVKGHAAWPPRADFGLLSIASGSTLLVLGGSGGSSVGSSMLNDVWRSEDGGSSWLQVEPVPVLPRLLQAPPNDPPLQAEQQQQQRSSSSAGYPAPSSAAGGSVSPGQCASSSAQPPWSGAAAASPSPPLPTAGPPAATAPPAVSVPAHNRFEEMSREQIRKAILDMQKGLADLTHRLDNVGEENSLLKEESALLKDAIDSRIEGSRGS